ncbi:MAG: translation initiation factor IF-2 [Sphaerochaetaceae bacterium]|nr:translation initiation factor IF-2 [Sphaerochaetaceae bacterium]
MPEDTTKPKATLIKQVKPVDVSPQPQAVITQSAPVEKKKVVVLKKKPTVVVKAQEQEKEREKNVVPSQREKAPEKKTDSETEKKSATKTTVEKNGGKNISQKAPEQRPVHKPSTVAQSVTVKKIVKKITAASTTINNGPIIISGDNLPPMFSKNDMRPQVSRPVGSVGGVSYGRDGQRLNPRFQPRGSRPQGQRGPIQGSYTPKSSQGGGRGSNTGFNRGPQGNRPGFPGKFSGRGGFQPAESISEGKNKRVFSKDKGRDRRHEIQDDEFELKQFGKKKSSDQAAVVSKNIDIMASITVSDLAKKMNIKASEIIAKLLSMGQMVSINQVIDSDTATIIAEEYGCQVHLIDLYEETVIESEKDSADSLKPRAPIVTVMGHVDHGKTKLLDAIRQTNVVEGEFGGITQHIGAYKVNIPGKGDVVFLDTPGHAAFTMMRARGAQLTDIVVLVVAANDGVMPQTLEAIDHAKAAKVPIVVAINKIDLPDAKPERVKQQLSERGLMPEEWGGDTMFCEISAKQKIGIDNLLETILLQAEVMELKANPDCRAEGKILEARIDQGRGTVASVIVQRGTLKQGDYYLAGIYSGRVRAMFDDKGKKIKSAGPSTPVEVIGLSDVPSAGDPFQVCEDEKQARQIGAKRQELERLNQASKFRKVTLETLNEAIKEGEAQELNIVIKGDVQGSVEALQLALEKLSTSEIRVHVIRAAAGAIIEDDINLASASENPALVIGFNVRPTPKAQARADEERVEIRKYNIIYNVVDDVKAAMEGMLSPERSEIDVGTAQVLQVFKIPKIGLIAGCRVNSGSVKRSNFLRIYRDNVLLSDELLKIASLKHLKDDVKEVTEGFECGIGIEDFQNIKEGDLIEFVEIRETARKLETSGEYI